MNKSFSDTITLNNGVGIPVLGLGTWQIEEGEPAVSAVRAGLEAGYRHIDTADAYENETSVGKAVRDFGHREDIFLTTKLWNEDHGYQSTLDAFERSRQKLDTDYIDLYLVHWPCGYGFAETWRAMEKLYTDDKVRAIGVSNFLGSHLDKLRETASVKPVIDQVETHPWLTQPALHAKLKEMDTRTESWSPLMQGRFDEVEALKSLAEKYGKHPTQILVRWNLQHGYIVIPKSSDAKHIAANADVFDFELSEEEMGTLDGLDRGERLGPDPDAFQIK